MAGDSNTVFPKFSVLVVLAILLVNLPTVAASGNGVLISNSTINLTDFQATNDSYFVIEFDLDSYGQSSSGYYEGSIYYEMQKLDGLVLSNQSINFNLSESSNQQISINITGLNIGYTVILVGLTGDVGMASTTHSSEFERTIHRLNPLNISIAPTSSILFESVDISNMPTGNNTISDGDYLQIQIPIINNGDFNWTGSLNITLESSNTTEEGTSEQFQVNDFQTVIITYNSTNQFFEGNIVVMIELDGEVDSHVEDNYRNFTISVQPPPLPIIQLDMFFDEANLVAGEILEIATTIYNNGTVSFTGVLKCNFNGESINDSSVTIEPQTNLSVNLSVMTKPGVIICEVLGQRIDISSSNISSIQINVESAIFELAGSPTPSALGGPWHAGDEAEISLLIRNSGQLTGNASLKIESNGVTIQGQPVILHPGEAGEVTLSMPLNQVGQQSLNWSLYTTDGDTLGDLFGSISIPVAERQTLDFTFTEVSWNTDDGIDASWSVNLSNGIQRGVNIKIGYSYLSEETTIFDVDMILEPGNTAGQINIGLIPADFVIIRVQEDNWTAQSSFSSYTKSIPDDRPNYDIEFIGQSNPNRPSYGQQSTVSVTLSNSGEVPGPNGNLILYSQSGKILDQKTTNSLDSGESTSVTFSFSWPDGSEVTLNCKWDYGDESKSIDRQFISSVIEQDSEESSIPWGGILGGLAVAAVVILLIRLRDPTKVKPQTKQPTISSREKTTQLSSIKIEISCPECSRQLRIPQDYSGIVRCPDCSNSFEVEDSTKETEQEEEIIESPSDGKVEISCPDCSQSLRIPSSYEGSVRCPSCKNIFKSTDSEV